ncbi:MAG: Do family serine endopeptidase, partial [bacterium]
MQGYELKGKQSKKWIYALLAVAFITGVWLLTDRGAGPSLCTGEDSSIGNGGEVLEIPREVVSLQDAFARVSDTVKPAVVNISTVQIVRQEFAPHEFFFGDPFEDFFDDFFGTPRGQKPEQEKQYSERKLEGTGSGVIIDPSGYILTNHHVIAQANQIKVTLSGKEDQKYDGRVIGKDARTDLAVIKIDSGEPFPAVPLGDSDKVRVGEWVIAIGSPFGLQQTVTSGIISAKRQSIPIEGQRFEDMLQTDAAINRGNSGGPLVNLRGEVIGINSAIYAPTGVFSGIGFAIPINKAKAILDDLIHKGKVVRGWLGIEIQNVDKAISKQFGLKVDEGVLVNNVMKDSPAEKGGLKRADVITMFDGKSVTDVSSLQQIVARTSPNTTVKVTVVRERQKHMLTVITGEMPSAAGEEKPEGDQKQEQKKTEEWLGMKVEPLTDIARKALGLGTEEKGVLVSEVKPGSKAQEAGLERGDCIKGINNSKIENLEDFKKTTNKADIKDGIVLD